MKSFEMGDITIKEFADFLNLLKNEDYKISICGITTGFWLNVDEEAGAIILDTENLSLREEEVIKCV